MKVKLKKVIIFASVLALLGIIGGIGFIYSGFYDIAARRPHLAAVRFVLLQTKTRSIQFHARDLVAPPLNEVEKIKRGFKLYRQNCVTCHGAPGEARSRVGIGLNPNPPPLVTVAENWSAEEIAWIISNGLKMAGMPAYALGESKEDIWAMTAFVLRLGTLSPAEYKIMVAYEDDSTKKHNPQWKWPDLDKEFQQLKSANRKKGKQLIKQYGCASCHYIPNISSSYSTVGPPLTAWAKRKYISGEFINTPKTLAEWIIKPSSFDDDTLMPDLNIKDSEAWDMAAYLFSL